MAISYLVKVVRCEPLSGYRLRVACSDGAEGVFDMSGYMTRGMFREVGTPEKFAAVRLVAGVPTWPGGIDIAPERVRSDMIPA